MPSATLIFQQFKFSFIIFQKFKIPNSKYKYKGVEAAETKISTKVPTRRI